MKVKEFIQNWGVLVAFILLYAINMVISPDVFLNPENLRNLFSQNADIGIITIGMTLVIIAGGIDLSVGSTLVLAGCGALKVQEMMFSSGASPMICLIASVVSCLLIGVLAGALNGLLITWGKIVPFIATLVGLLAFRSLAQVIADEGTLTSSVSEFQNIANTGLEIPFIRNSNDVALKIYWPILVFIVMALIAGVLLNKTKLGRYFVAVGSNEKATHYSGVAVNKIKFLSYTILGLFVGVAALMTSSKLGSVNSGSTGILMELDAIAAVVIGGTLLSGGRGRIWGTFVGVLLLTMINQMLIANEISTALQSLVKGVIILVAVLIQRSDKKI